MTGSIRFLPLVTASPRRSQRESHAWLQLQSRHGTPAGKLRQIHGVIYAMDGRYYIRVADHDCSGLIRKLGQVKISKQDL